MDWLLKKALAILARSHNYAVEEQLALPAPPRQLLLAPPMDIRVGSFVRFKESVVRDRGGNNWNHWARAYGNGVGIVRNIKIWGGNASTTAQIDFPHRMECHRLEDIELARDADRAMSMLKHGPMYGPSIRLQPPKAA